MSETRLNQRAVIRVSATEAGKEQGEDCRDFLQGLVTQNIASVQEDAPQWAALLSAQGKVLFDFFLWADGDDILIDAEREHAEDLIKRLKLYRLRRKITIEMDLAMTVHWSLDAADQPSDPWFADLG
ncbi:MAG: folate-binding protein, partial [Sphingorhabdus sp.]|nr:folate-binding protein [Sphingorhabdus sp.]